MALHDLRGKALGKPCHELLGGAVKKSITPYASLQPEVSSFAVYRRSIVEWALRAKKLGFRAAKIEVTPCGPYAHKGLKASHEEMTEVIGEVRNAVGKDFTLMVDVQYAFPDADTCLKAIRPWVDFNLFFIETPLPSDDLAGYARLDRRATDSYCRWRMAGNPLRVSRSDGSGKDQRRATRRRPRGRIYRSQAGM